MFSRVHTAVCRGIEGKDVYVETDVTRGLPGVNIVGLASTMILESRERIRSAIVNSGLEYPRGRITVNLTPASLRKNGSCLDLPIAVGILASCMMIDSEKLEHYGIIGELALDGEVKGVQGILPMIMQLRKTGAEKIILPYENLYEAEITGTEDILPVKDILECIGVINGDRRTERAAIRWKDREILPKNNTDGRAGDLADFADICGHESAKRAITVAAAGRHGLLMIGSPGCGKTMLARRIPTIMAEMSEKEIIETAIIYSATGKMELSDRNESGGILARPFRNPHHTIGRAGLIGGGMIPVPGEITLAHNGVLFLDEICEFDQDKIEALRQPIEDGSITHFRQGEAFVFPCDFQLVMASNPCPCGYRGDRQRLCKCSEAQLERYRKKLSGPISDRIDMKINMETVSYSEIKGEGNHTSSEEMRAKVLRALEFARACGRNSPNSAIPDNEVERFCRLGASEESFMKNAYSSLALSPRSYIRTIKVARTIADLEMSPEIKTVHLAEALSYRIKESGDE